MLTTSKTLTGSGYIKGDNAGDTIILTGDGDVSGGNGNDIIYAGPGNSGIYTGTGNDIIVAGPVGVPWVVGGGGFDTFVTNRFHQLENISVVPGTSSLTVFAPNLHATITNIQAVQFIDGTVQIGNESSAAQITRLYHTILGRTPDANGLASWATAIRSGGSLASVAQAFLASSENQTGNVNQSNAAFVTQIYQNALGRAPDSAGLGGWVAALQSGAAQRADIAVSISESTESQARWGSSSSLALTWMPDEQAAAVARLYDTAFGRLPDAAGLAGWINALEGTPLTLPSLSLRDEAAKFMTSPEFTGRYGTPSDAGFVQLLYQNTLHRAPDTPGLAAWTSALSSGAIDRASVMLGFGESSEHQSMLASRIEASGIVTSG